MILRGYHYILYFVIDLTTPLTCARALNYTGSPVIKDQIVTLSLHVPWSCRLYQQLNSYHLYRLYHRAHRRWGTGHKQRWQELELPRRTSIREKFSLVNQSASNALTSWSSKKYRETRQREEWNTWVRFPEWWWWHSIFRTRGWISRQKRFPLWRRSTRFNSRIVFI